MQRLEDRLAPSAGYFRVVSYNIASSNGPPRSGLETLLAGIGAEPVAGRSEVIDLIALQEVQSQATTTAAVAALLNNQYGTNAFKSGTVNGNSMGSGTLGVVFNSLTLQLLGEATIGETSPTGQPRQTMRYHFQPVGYPASTAFFVYNSHYKSDNGLQDQARRQIEAEAIRADADTLGNANILYVGDFNSYSSNETFYSTVLMGPGPGQAFDPINMPGNWSNNSSFASIFTQAPSNSPPGGLTGGGLDDRFDFVLQSNELTDGVGLEFVANTYHTFGNNGSVAVNGNINDSKSTALPTLPNRTTLLDLLTTVSDHLPVVADYQVLVPPTASIQINDGADQRSMVRDLSVTFSENVSFPSGITAAMQLHRTGPGGPTGLVNLSANQVGNVVTLTFNDSTFAPALGSAKSLIDGNYTLTLIASKITGTGGSLDGNADGVGGDNQVLLFHRLFGDADGNRSVTAADFAALRLAFGGSSFTFDVDGDGIISAADFSAFRLRYGVII